MTDYPVIVSGEGEHLEALLSFYRIRGLSLTALSSPQLSAYAPVLTPLDALAIALPVAFNPDPEPIREEVYFYGEIEGYNFEALDAPLFKEHAEQPWKVARSKARNLTGRRNRSLSARAQKRKSKRRK